MIQLTDRLVVIGSEEFAVRAPTLREALVVLHSTEAAARLDADALDMVRDTARGWLPPRLYKALFPVPTLWKRALKLVPALRERLELEERLHALPGAKAVSEILTSELQREAEEESEEAPETARQSVTEIDWSQLIAEYARAYGMAPSSVFDEPWDLFLELAGRVSALEARDDLRLLSVRSLPYAEDEDREALLDDLRRRARLTPNEDGSLREEREAKVQSLLQAARLAGALAPSKSK